MPNAISATGLTTATQAELVALFTSSFELIYGADIDLDPESPDGQMMMIFIQSVLDVEDLIAQVNAQFDPDQAIGVVLDQRVAINGIQRQAATNTVTPITVVVAQALTLQGLDLFPNAPYTIADSSGNQYQLQTTQNPAMAGTFIYSFVAATPGALNPTQNTITVPVTIVLGVTSVNNPTSATSVGVNEESDAALKVRRQKSVAVSSQGFFNGLYAAIANVPGVTFLNIVENDTNGTVNGVPSHSLWIIVAGSGSAQAIGTAIYTKRSEGCGLYSSSGTPPSYTVTQADGSLFTVIWDTVSPVNIFIKATLSSLNSLAGLPNPTVPQYANIRAQLPNNYVPGVYSEVNINQLATFIQSIDSNSLVTLSGFSLTSGGSYTTYLLPAVQNNQFVLTAANIILLPMIIAPATGGTLSLSGGVVTSTATVVNGGSHLTFSTLGGYGTDHSGSAPNLTYSVLSSTGGGSSIVSATGVYTSGAAGTDVIQVSDALSNTSICTVTVT